MVAPISGIGGIASVGRVAGAGSVERTAAPGFADKVQGALEAASAAEREADAKARDVAAGGDTPVHELMVATTKASLSVEMLVQLRNRAVEAYQEIMRMQV